MDRDQKSDVARHRLVQKSLTGRSIAYRMNALVKAKLQTWQFGNDRKVNFQKEVPELLYTIHIVEPIE